jgi:uncharacterized protein
MRLNEIRFTDAVPVDGYGPGFFRIGGKVYHGPVIVLPAGVVGWAGFDETLPLLAAVGTIDVLFVGTGTEIAHLPLAFREALESAGLGVEGMSSPAACRTFNVLLSEGRRVGLALIPC